MITSAAPRQKTPLDASCFESRLPICANSIGALQKPLLPSSPILGSCRTESRAATSVIPLLFIPPFMSMTLLAKCKNRMTSIWLSVPYKRVDIAVAACTQLGRKLIIIGEDSERKLLEAMAGPTVTFVGAQPLSVLREHYQRCRAFLFPGIEDFGIAPLEAQAAGRPVLAFRRGGAYLGLLRKNQICMHSIVMFRRRALEPVGGYDTSLPACEDYDLYLRIARLAKQYLIL